MKVRGEELPCGSWLCPAHLRTLVVLNALDMAPQEPQNGPGKCQNRRRHVVVAIGVLAVGMVLVGLSLSHLEEGVRLVTGSGPTAAWSMANGLDHGFVALECALLVAPVDIRPGVARYAGPAIIGIFDAHAEGLTALASARHRPRNSSSNPRFDEDRGAAVACGRGIKPDGQRLRKIQHIQAKTPT